MKNVLEAEEQEEIANEDRNKRRMDERRRWRKDKEQLKLNKK